MSLMRPIVSSLVHEANGHESATRIKKLGDAQIDMVRRGGLGIIHLRIKANESDAQQLVNMELDQKRRFRNKPRVARSEKVKQFRFL